MPKVNYRTGFTARMVLVLTLLQFVFLVMDAASVVEEADHLEYSLQNEELESDGASTSSPQDAVGGASDHCCHCQGHGAHLSPLLSEHSLLSNMKTVAPVSRKRSVQTTFSHSIYRPPIR